MMASACRYSGHLCRAPRYRTNDCRYDPFVVHTVNHEQYGTLFESFGSSGETVSARLVALPKPVGLCGQWTLNLEVAGLNTAAIGLGGGDPFALY